MSTRFNWSRSATTLVCVVIIAAGCSDSTPRTPASPSPSNPLTISGDPGSAQGATWTYRGSVEGSTVDLQGVLLKPAGSGPFPAVIISHGAGGNANGYSRGVAIELVQWGLVAVATNYTHAGGVPIGSPGSFSEPGASQSNIIRARAAYEVLRQLGYVDMSRVAAHGHSMGAFVTSALVGAYPGDFRVASHTAGGVRIGTNAGEAAAPIESQVRTIRVPYQLHHGDADVVVPLALDQRLIGILTNAGVVSELHIYAGAEHNDVARSAAVFTRVRAWYAAHGLF